MGTLQNCNGDRLFKTNVETWADKFFIRGCSSWTGFWWDIFLALVERLFLNNSEDVFSEVPRQNSIASCAQPKFTQHLTSCVLFRGTATRGCFSVQQISGMHFWCFSLCKKQQNAVEISTNKMEQLQEQEGGEGKSAHLPSSTHQWKHSTEWSEAVSRILLFI